jgi:LasA protease
MIPVYQLLAFKRKSLRRYMLIFILVLMPESASCSRTLPEAPAPFRMDYSGLSNTPMLGLTATPGYQLPSTRIPGSLVLSPTPDEGHFILAKTNIPETYIVQAGDTLAGIARSYGMSVNLLLSTNSIRDPNLLSEGQTLIIPHPTPQTSGSDFKIIPDSELVFGPMSAGFNLDSFIQIKAGYLAGYTQDIDGEALTGAQIVQLVAESYSVNPRLLLALLEYRSGWVTTPNPSPVSLAVPMGIADGYHDGLYRQLTWTANMLNRGFYLWQINGINGWNLADGSIAPVVPTINAGTAGVQSYFASVDDYSTWLVDVSINGLFATYYSLFGYSFDLAIEPLTPTSLVQPVMQLPFESGILWSFTGGPHGGWDVGSAWAALDFAPSGIEGYMVSNDWVTAVADGLIVRSGNGAVVQDLDGDGFEQTGWTILYMHIESRERVIAGMYIHAGERIGHPSWEGGIGDATHLHLARRFNGEWISADGLVPFNLDGWISTGTGVEYDGYLTLGGRSVEAYNGNDEINQIIR